MIEIEIVVDDGIEEIISWEDLDNIIMRVQNETFGIGVVSITGQGFRVKVSKVNQ